jgi:hypothetical protein
VGLKFNWTHRLLANDDDMNLLGDNIDTINENIGTLIECSKEVSPARNLEKTKYMLVPHDQNSVQN